jgi:hypothetical protein
MEIKIRCRNCRFFYITWDKKFPYGCKALRFKSRNMPCNVVKGSSGLPCQFFASKEEPPPPGGSKSAIDTAS